MEIIAHIKTSSNVLLQAKKQVSYAESDSEGEDDDEQIFGPTRRNRAKKRRKTSPESDDDFQQDGDDAGHSDDGES